MLGLASRARSALLFGIMLALAPSVVHAQPTPPRAAPKLTKPPRVLKFVAAPHPPGDSRAAVVVLSIAISATGTVDDAKVTESAGAAFDAAALAAVKQLAFEPAEIDGRPAPIRILYRYEFTLEVEAPATAIFEGIVRDRDGGKPLPGVAIEVLGDGGGRATTDATGKFRIEGIGPGKHAVSLSGEKLTALRTEEVFEAGKRVEASYDIVLGGATTASDDEDDLELVVVAPALDKKVVATEVSAEEGRRLPGTQGDVLKVVESMPGVARAQAGSGALVVWGSAPEDTRVYVDGVRVPRLYHGGGVRSILATDLVDAVELAPGGWGAAWGRGLGGLVTVRTRRADEDRLKASASVDVIDAGANVRAPIAKDVRVAIAARRSHLHSTIAPLADDATEDLFPIPRYEDAQARVAWAIGPRERIDLTGLHSSDRITRSAPSADPTRDRSEARRLSFQRIYARYERDGERGGGTVSIVPWFGFDRSSIESRFGGIPTRLSSDATLGGLRASWRGRLGAVAAVAVGIDGEVVATKVDRAGSVTNPAREGDARVFGQVPADRINVDRWRVTNVGIAPWAELDATPFGEKLHIVPGVRFDPYVTTVSRKTPVEGDTPSVGSFRQNAAIEPRLAARWQPVPRLGLRAAYGRYHQPAAAEDLSAVIGNPLLPAAAAHHVVGGSAVRILEKTSLETTAFYTVQEDLAMRSTLASPLLAEALVPIGRGRSYGAQILFRQELARGLTGWLSYTVARSQRRDTRDGAWRLSDYDQSHVLTAVASYALGRGFEIGARVRAATGFPRTPVVAALYDARRDVGQPLLGAKNTERIPAFFQLDLRVAKSWVTAAGTLEAYLEVQNVTDRANPEEVVYSSTYARKDYLTGLPILPILGARWSL